MKQQSVSKLQVLKALSDEISLDIFNEVGTNTKTSDDIMRILGITRKQYYIRSSRLIEVGLIKKKGEISTLTSLGKLIYHAQLKIGRAAHHSWKLKVIDSLSSNNKMSDSESKEIVDKLIDDPEMKKLLLLKTKEKNEKNH